MKVPLLVAATFTAVSTPASADTEPTRSPVSENVALGLSLGGTVVSYAAVIGGIALDQPGMIGAGVIGTVVAPSAGHWYSRKAVSRGFLLRAAGVGVVGIGGVLIVFAAVGGSIGSDTTSLGAGAGAILLGGCGLYVAGTIDDIAHARSAARSYNERTTVTFVPTANAHGGGLSLVGRF